MKIIINVVNIPISWGNNYYLGMAVILFSPRMYYDINCWNVSWWWGICKNYYENELTTIESKNWIHFSTQGEKRFRILTIEICAWKEQFRPISYLPKHSSIYTFPLLVLHKEDPPGTMVGGVVFFLFYLFYSVMFSCLHCTSFSSIQKRLARFPIRTRLFPIFVCACIGDNPKLSRSSSLNSRQNDLVDLNYIYFYFMLVQS